LPVFPKKELVEKIHFHQRQGEIAERALGFYLHDLDKRKMFRPYEDAAEWARKHLPQDQRPDKLVLLAKRLEKLPAIEAAFHSGEVPWTKIREIARIADEDTEVVWLNAARRLTSRELEEEVRGKKRGDRPGGGLKARRTRYLEPISLKPHQKPIYGRRHRKAMRTLPRGLHAPRRCGDLPGAKSRGPAEKAPKRRLKKTDVHLVVLHLGLDERGMEGLGGHRRRPHRDRSQDHRKKILEGRGPSP
jgi:hypothetical protein